VDTLREQIQAFLSLPREARTRARRAAVLGALGVPHPSHFIEEVWTGQWEAGIDRLLDPANTRIRPLEPTDFHFKWALGAFNALPASVRARLFALKVEASGLRAPILALLCESGVAPSDFEVVDLVALSKVHAEAAVTVRVPDGRTCHFEVSHFAPSAAGLYGGAARVFGLRTAPACTHRLPHGGQVLLEVPLEGIRLDLADLSWQDVGPVWPNAVQGAADHDALGDVLGTILRDPHYVLTPAGEVASIHNYELFHEIGGLRFGFVEPTFLILWRAALRQDPGMHRSLLLRMFDAYRTAYLQKHGEVRSRWGDLEAYLTANAQAVQEYLEGKQDWREALDAVRQRAYRDPARWIERLREVYATSVAELSDA
jgi:hypothetical protein